MGQDHQHPVVVTGRFRSLAAVVSVMLSAGLPGIGGVAMGDITYSLTRIEPLEGGSIQQINAINDNGVVVGQASGYGVVAGAFRFDAAAGTSIHLGNLGYDFNGETHSGSSATAINNAGVIVGWSRTDNADFYSPNSASNAWRAVRWNNGAIEALDQPPGITTGYTADAVTADGRVVVNGFASTHDAAFIVAADQTSAVSLGNPPGDPFYGSTLFVPAVNTLGHFAGVGTGEYGGSRAVLNTGSGWVDLGNLSGTEPSRAWDVSDQGVVVGASGSNGFVWTPDTPNSTDGSMQSIGLLDGHISASALAVNNSGQIVGYSSEFSGTTTGTAVLWTQDGGLVDLNTLVDETAAGWHLATAVDINNYGQIIGQGRYDPDGPGGTSSVLTPSRVTGPVSAPVQSGQDQTVGSGSAGVAGATTATFEALSSGGLFTSDYQPQADPEDFADAAGADAINFALPGTGVQGWHLSFDGQLQSQSTIELVFHYDPTLLAPGTDESQLTIYHFTGGQWVAESGQLVDVDRNTITVTTDSFSPFVLGVIPEPATAALLGLGGLAMLGRRRS